MVKKHAFNLHWQVCCIIFGWMNGLKKRNVTNFRHIVPVIRPRYDKIGQADNKTGLKQVCLAPSNYVSWCLTSHKQFHTDCEINYIFSCLQSCGKHFSLGLTLIISFKETRFYEDVHIYLAVSRDFLHTVFVSRQMHVFDQLCLIVFNYISK